MMNSVFYDDEVRFGTGPEMIEEIKELRRQLSALPDLMVAAEQTWNMWAEGSEDLDKEMDRLRSALSKVQGGQG